MIGNPQNSRRGPIKTVICPLKFVCSVCFGDIFIDSHDFVRVNFDPSAFERVKKHGFVNRVKLGRTVILSYNVLLLHCEFPKMAAKHAV